MRSTCEIETIFATLLVGVVAVTGNNSRSADGSWRFAVAKRPGRGTRECSIRPDGAWRRRQLCLAAWQRQAVRRHPANLIFCRRQGPGLPAHRRAVERWRKVAQDRSCRLPPRQRRLALRQLTYTLLFLLLFLPARDGCAHCPNGASGPQWPFV